jgi:hypothetical protein
MRHVLLSAWMSLLVVTTGCTSDGGKDAASPTPTRTSAQTSPGPSRPQTSSQSPPDGAADLLLAQQITLLGAGDGAAPDCVADLSVLPSRFLESAAAWVSSITGPKSIPIPQTVSLCLHGFSPNQEVKVTVSAGSRDYTTSVMPTTEKLTFQRYEPAASLFEGGLLKVYAVGNEVFQSERWDFVPPDPAREDLAAARRLTIRATQDGNTSSYAQPVALPTEPERFWVETGKVHRLLVYGFKPGMRVPIGLYKGNQGIGEAKLVRRIGVVVMPQSRAAIFTVPQDVVAETGGKGDYCVTVPLKEQFNCPAL